MHEKSVSSLLLESLTRTILNSDELNVDTASVSVGTTTVKAMGVNQAVLAAAKALEVLKYYTVFNPNVVVHKMIIQELRCRIS